MHACLMQSLGACLIHMDDLIDIIARSVLVWWLQSILTDRDPLILITVQPDPKDQNWTGEYFQQHVYAFLLYLREKKKFFQILERRLQQAQLGAVDPLNDLERLLSKIWYLARWIILTEGSPF